MSQENVEVVRRVCLANTGVLRDDSAMRAVVHRRNEGEHHGMGSSEVIIKATGDDTAGSFFLSETTIEPGFPGPPPHHHERLHDMFYVLDGVLTMRVGE